MPLTAERISYLDHGEGHALLADALSGYGRAREFLHGFSGNTDSILPVLDALDARSFHRQKLYEVIFLAQRSMRAPEPAQENARRLRDHRAYVILATLTPSLLGGGWPAWCAAHSAVLTARRLNDTFGERAHFVPLLWITGGDGLKETHLQVDLLGRDGDTKSVRVPPPAPLGSISAQYVRLAREEIALLDFELVKSGGVDESTASTWLAPYRRAHLSSAFARLFIEQFGEAGLLVLEDWQLAGGGGSGVLGEGLFAQEVSEFARTNDMLRKAGAELEAAGYPRGWPQDLPGPHLYKSTREGLCRLEPRLDGDDYVFREAPVGRPNGPAAAERLAGRTLRNLIKSLPGSFVPDPVLRALLQCLVFPVAAVIFDPDDWSLRAQLGPLFDAHGLTKPVPAPRMRIVLPGDASPESTTAWRSPQAVDAKTMASVSFPDPAARYRIQ